MFNINPKHRKTIGIIFVVLAGLLIVYGVYSTFFHKDDNSSVKKNEDICCYDDMGDMESGNKTETSFDNSSKTKYIIPDKIKNQIDEKLFISTFESHLKLNNMKLPKEVKYVEKEGSTDPLNFYLLLDGSQTIEVEKIKNQYAFTNV